MAFSVTFCASDASCFDETYPLLNYIQALPHPFIQSKMDELWWGGGETFTNETLPYALNLRSILCDVRSFPNGDNSFNRYARLDGWRYGHGRSIHLQFDISTNALEIRALQSSKFIV
jgi:hypothetical protein